MPGSIPLLLFPRENSRCWSPSSPEGREVHPQPPGKALGHPSPAFARGKRKRRKALSATHGPGSAGLRDPDWILSPPCAATCALPAALGTPIPAAQTRYSPSPSGFFPAPFQQARSKTSNIDLLKSLLSSPGKRLRLQHPARRGDTVTQPGWHSPGGTARVTQPG